MGFGCERLRGSAKMGELRCIDACDSDGNLSKNLSARFYAQLKILSYRSVLEFLPSFGDLSEPTPAHSTSARGVEEVEAVSVTHARDSSEKTSVPKEIWPNIGCARYSPQVVCVELQGR